MILRVLALGAVMISPILAMAQPPLPTAFDAKWHGKTVCEPLFENAAMRAARCTFPPGGGHERHTHPPHWGYIVEGGTMQTTDAKGARVRELKSGSSWWSDGIAWHEAVNVGTTTSVYVIVEPKSATLAASDHPSRVTRSETFLPPPPPPPIRDPIPGPFIVEFDNRGGLNEEQLGVIESAIKSWLDAKTDTFMLCFRSPKTRIDYNASFAALKSVSAELKARGAKVIVLPAGSICEGSPHSAVAGKRVIEILGLVRD